MKIALALVFVAFLLPAVVYDRLPQQIPSHFNARGEVDGYTAKPWGAFLMPLVMTGVVALFAALPRISPRGYEIDPRSRAFSAFLLATLAVLLVVHITTLLVALGYAVPTNALMPLFLGGMFVALGNYLTKVPRNFFIGIRTPWTLADEDVWFRTHRLGGRTFVSAGLLLMAIGPFLHGNAAPVFVGVVIAAAAGIPLVYSYVTYRKDHP